MLVDSAVLVVESASFKPVSFAMVLLNVAFTADTQSGKTLELTRT